MKPLSLRFAPVVLSTFAFLCVCSHGWAQEDYDMFGKNKVQYHRFNWSYIQTDHFDIYFDTGGHALADFTAAAAEAAYTSISKSFRYQLVNRVPIIVYNSHNAFQQTNVVSEYLEEGIGGVTELFKNRVILPFEGDYKKFRHVIHHELVHAVINDMFYGGSIQSIITNNISLQLPLWMNEGLAEYESLKWDTDSDMFLRDATDHEYLPEIRNLYGYWAYRGGQSVWWYIANKYGEQKVGEILNRIKSTRSVEAGFRGSIGLSIEELSERWQKEQKVLYWPDIAKREEPSDYARRLTDHRKDGGFYNTSPAITPQGDKIAFITNRNDYFDIYVMSALDGKLMTKVVSGNTTNNFEELHLLTPGISWSPDGKKLALAVKAGAEDAIVIVDPESGDEQKLTFGLEGIFSVEWSPKGNVLAFVGNTSSQSDIYTYDLDTKTLTNVTDDIFSDQTPVWTPDGSAIYFSSDRGGLSHGGSVMEQGLNQFDLYRVDVASRAVTRITDWPHSDEESPVVSPDAKSILFISDRNGINNIYRLDVDSGKFRPITNSLSGVYQLSLSHDGTKLAFSSLNNAGFDIFLLRNPFDRDIKVAELEPTEFYKAKYAAPAPPAPPTVAAAATADTSAAAKLAAMAKHDTVAAKTDTVAAKSDTAAAHISRATVQQEPDTTHRYGNNVQIDFSNYIFRDSLDQSVPSDSSIMRMPKLANNIDTNGDYRVNKYKLNFTPDIVYGNAGYDTFYGVTGSTVMAFSDLMGDHQIVFETNLLLDLKNSDYGLQYYYLPNRTDFGFGGFHSARFVYVDDPIYGVSLFRFLTYGASLSALYPFDRYDRMDFGLSWYNISKENLDYTDDPIQTRVVLVPSIAYTHDTSLWGIISPMNGTRYRFNIFGTPRLGVEGLSFVNAVGDYRTYLRLGHNYALALRLAGGGSFGKNPQKFIIGGVDNWINREFDGGYVPLQNAEDYLFLQVGTPLRGYNYVAALGSKYALFNMEFRYPLFALVQAGPLPLGLQSLGGVMFFDAGSAWDANRDYRAFTRTPDGSVTTQDLLMGMGTGARIYFLAFLVKFDVAWAWHWNSFSPPKYYFSLGADF
ncbi:MAG TPA: BamA/TamA family outer membrane protein [Bacteroidota bacterium]|nr:BamA/TamA family outer membrane protein [Bacteroidota bacterium]